MVLNEEQFITGFNSGYLLAKYEPQILSALLKDIRPLNSYIRGMSSGQKEYELQHTKSHLDELNQIRQKNRDEKDREND